MVNFGWNRKNKTCYQIKLRAFVKNLIDPVRGLHWIQRQISIFSYLLDYIQRLNGFRKSELIFLMGSHLHCDSNRHCTLQKQKLKRIVLIFEYEISGSHPQQRLNYLWKKNIKWQQRV